MSFLSQVPPIPPPPLDLLQAQMNHSAQSGHTPGTEIRTQRVTTGSQTITPSPGMGERSLTQVTWAQTLTDPPTTHLKGLRPVSHVHVQTDMHTLEYRVNHVQVKRDMPATGHRAITHSGMQTDPLPLNSRESVNVEPFLSWTLLFPSRDSNSHGRSPAPGPGPDRIQVEMSSDQNTIKTHFIPSGG